MIIINQVNGEQYVGATTRDLMTRFEEHIRGTKRRKHQVLHDAIKKYGCDKFTIEKLQDCSTFDELECAEARWITELHTLVSERGYNVALTNNAMKGRQHTPKTKRRLSEINTGSRHPMWGRHQTETTRQRIKLNCPHRRDVQRLSLDVTPSRFTSRYERLPMQSVIPIRQRSDYAAAADAAPPEAASGGALLKIPEG